VLIFPSSSSYGLYILGIGRLGALDTEVIVGIVDVDMDLDTGLMGGGVFLTVLVVVEYERKCEGTLCWLNPVTWIKLQLKSVRC